MPDEAVDFEHVHHGHGHGVRTTLRVHRAAHTVDVRVTAHPPPPKITEAPDTALCLARTPRYPQRA